MADRTTRINALQIAVIACLFLTVSLGVCTLPRKGDDVAVLVPFNKNPAFAAAIVLKSGGTFRDAAWQGHVLIVRSDDPHFTSKLYANGALLVFNPRVIAGCRG
jgi:hypothetical protein